MYQTRTGPTLWNPKPEEIQKFQSQIRTDPVWFIEDAFECYLWDKQIEIVRSVRDNPKTTVRSCHGTGKSYVSARIALWFMFAFTNAVVITTAPTWRQVEEILWREMNSAFSKAKDILGGRMLKTKFDLGPDWYAIGLSTKEPDKFQGFHAENILAIIDEGAGVNELIFNALDGCLTSANSKRLILGNPTSLDGTFYNSFRDPKYYQIHISCFDTPNFKANGIKTISDLRKIDPEKCKIVNPALITPTWAKDKLEDWGEDSPVFEARVLGNFPSQGDDTLIPLNKIEEACTEERKAELEERMKRGEFSSSKFYGVDPARFGSDKTGWINRRGPITDLVKQFSGKSTMEVAGMIAKEAMDNQYHGNFLIDTIGIGAGVYDRCKEMENVKKLVYSVNVAEKPSSDKADRFVNLRAEIYWLLRELFIKGDIYIPNDPDLINQLASIKYKIKDSSGKIYVESKEDIRKRIGRSPDVADALALSYAPVIFHAKASQIRTSKSYAELLSGK